MNFKELLSQIDVETAPDSHHHSTPGWIQFDCPYCGTGTKKFHMGYSINGHFVNCWRCGRHGIVETLQALTSRSPSECYALIQQVDRGKWRPEEKLTGTKLVFPKGIYQLKKIHREYLKSRNFNPKEIVNLYEVQGITRTTERTSLSLFIPVFFHSQIVSWTTRTITEGSWSRYNSAKPDEELTRHKNLLYNEDTARHAIVITEGPIDVWRFGPGAVATFGTNVTMAQINKMTKYPIRAICFDNDRQSQKTAKRLYDMLSEQKGETYNIELDSKDLGCAKPKEIKRIKKLLNL
jgi:hypothetical protein